MGDRAPAVAQWRVGLREFFVYVTDDDVKEAFGSG